MTQSPLPPRDAQVRLEEERAELALSAGAILGTWLWDVAADRLTVDDAFVDAFGVGAAPGPNGLTLAQAIELVHPDDRAGLSVAIEAALRRGGSYVHQYRIRRRGGEYRWVEASGRVDLDADGAAVSFPGVLVDADHRRRIEAERDRAQTLLSSFIEAMPGVVYAKDREGRLMIGNRGTTELIGRPPEAYIGRTDAELLADKAQAAEVMATDARIMASGQVEQLEEHVSFPDGTSAWWLSTKAPLLDADGNVIGLVGTSLDITARKEVEARHQEIEERYRLAARATNDAIWDWRMADGHVIWNEALATLFGHAVSETSAQWWLDHIHPEDRPRVDAGIHAVIDHGRDWSDEYRFRRADGSYAVVLDRGTVLKGPEGAPVRMIGAMLDLSRRKADEAALAESEERLRLATEASDIGFWDVDLVHDQLIWPARTKAMFGISAHVPVSMRDFYEGLHPQDREATTAAFAAAADPEQRAGYDVEYRTVGREDGLVRWIAAKGRGLFVEGRCVRVVGVAMDITARRNAEEQLRELNERLESRVAEEVAERIKVEETLRQSQKMDAVGQLTGGIAHDFNNMLAVVIGSLDLLSLRIGDSDPRARRSVEAALEGAGRAAQLTQRLLAFSRQQALRPEPVDVNALVAGMSELLAHSIGRDVRLESVLGDGVWPVWADPHQLENVILNLAVNARDAMPEGGRLVVATRCHVVEPQAAAELAGLVAGEYVVITVADTGRGMLPDVAARAFEPFFTTKEVGRGTGLGLSQVYGFVRQSGGEVGIASEPGQGTTVTIYLPRMQPGREGASVVPGAGTLAAAPAVPSAPPEVPRDRWQQVILVVDDEPAVREVSVEALRRLGYPVLEAEGAAPALELLDAHPEITLLFTDVVMPEVNGRKLADEACRRRPGLKVLFTTGYSGDAFVARGVLDPGVPFVSKPFTVAELSARVREVLGDPPSG